MASKTHNRTSLLTVLLLIICGTLTAAAQQPASAPVRWRTIVRMTSATTGTVTFRALVASGWHLYGLDMPKGGPKATTFDLSESAGMEFTSPVTPASEPVKAIVPLFGQELQWWDSNVQFTVSFRLTEPRDKARLKAAIGYMCCDGTTCRPPVTERISAPIPEYNAQ